MDCCKYALFGANFKRHLQLEAVETDLRFRWIFFLANHLGPSEEVMGNGPACWRTSASRRELGRSVKKLRNVQYCLADGHL